jgi:hypothetical protein
LPSPDEDLPAPGAGAPAGGDGQPEDPRDYDVDSYLRLLRSTFAARLARALTPEDFEATFADPEQPSLFARSLAEARPVLVELAAPPGVAHPPAGRPGILVP